MSLYKTLLLTCLLCGLLARSQTTIHQKMISAVPLKNDQVPSEPPALDLLEDGQRCSVQLSRSATSANGIVAVLLDASHFLPGSFVNSTSQAVKAAAGKFLEKLTLEQPVVVYTSNAGALRIIRDLADETDAAVPPRIKQGAASETRAALTFFNVPPINPHSTVQVHLIGATVFSLNVVKSIADHLSQLPGRKSLVWLCQETSFNSVPLTSSSLYHPWVQTMNALQRADMAVYPIACSDGGRGGATPPSVSASGQPLVLEQGRAKLQESGTTKSAATMERDLAAMSGGRYYVGLDQLGKAVSDSLSDNQHSYQVTWVSPNGSENTIQQLAVRPDKVFLYRRTYYNPAQPNLTAERLASIEQSLAIPLSAHSLPISLQYITDAPQTGTLTVSFDPRSVEFSNDNTSRNALLDMVCAFHDSLGERLKTGSRNEVKLQVATQDMNKFLASWHSTRQRLTIPSTARTLTVALRDSRSGAIGSSTISLH